MLFLLLLLQPQELHVDFLGAGFLAAGFFAEDFFAGALPHGLQPGILDIL